MAVQNTPFNAHINKIRTLLAFAQSKSHSGIEWKNLWERIQSSVTQLQSPPAHISTKQLQDLTLALTNLEKADLSQEDFAVRLKTALEQINGIYKANNSLAQENASLPQGPPPMNDEFEEGRAMYLEYATYSHAESVLNYYPLTLKHLIEAFRVIKAGGFGPEPQKTVEEPDSLMLEQQNVLKILLYYVLKSKSDDFEKVEVFNIQKYVSKVHKELTDQYNQLVIEILERKITCDQYIAWELKRNAVIKEAESGEKAIHEIKMKLALSKISLEDLLKGKNDEALQPTLNTAVAVMQKAFPREGFYGLFHAQRMLSAPCLDSVNVLNSLDLIDEAIELAEQLPLEENGPWQDVACKLMQKCTSHKKTEGGQKLASKIMGLSSDPVLLGQISWFYYSSGKLEEAFHALIKTYRYLPPDEPRAPYDCYLAKLLHEYSIKNKIGPALDKMLQLVKQIDDEDIQDLLDFRQSLDYGSHFLRAVRDLNKLREENRSLLQLWPQMRNQVGIEAPSEMTSLQIRKWFREHENQLLAVKSLSLTSEQTSLPDQISLFKGLTHLKLEGFHLRIIPTWITALPHIQELSLQNCGLEYLLHIEPEKKFLHLKKIDLRNNPLFVPALPVSLCQWGGRPSFAALYVLCDAPEAPSEEKVSAALRQFNNQDAKLFRESSADVGLLKQALLKTAEAKLSRFSSTQFNEVVNLSCFLEDGKINLKASGDLVVSKEWLLSDPVSLMMAIDLTQNEVVILK